MSTLIEKYIVKTNYDAVFVKVLKEDVAGLVSELLDQGILVMSIQISADDLNPLSYLIKVKEDKQKLAWRTLEKN